VAAKKKKTPDSKPVAVRTLKKDSRKKTSLNSNLNLGSLIESKQENCVILQSGCEMFAFLCLFISQPALRSDAMLKTKNYKRNYKKKSSDK